MSEDYLEEMTTILHRLAEALVATLPEGWGQARLRVEVQQAAGVTELSHTIGSTQHPGEVVVPTEALCTATRELQLHSERGGQLWRALVFGARREGDNWRFTVEFEYPARADVTDDQRSNSDSG